MLRYIIVGPKFLFVGRSVYPSQEAFGFFRRLLIQDVPEVSTYSITAHRFAKG